jgi:L,D-transpeptidase catalytic domain
MGADGVRGRLGRLLCGMVVLVGLLGLSTVHDPAVAVAGNGCPGGGHSVVIDKARQRAWFCNGGSMVGRPFGVTTHRYQPGRGTYRVFSKSTAVPIVFSGRRAYLDWWVGFAYGRYTGKTIGLHAVPRYAGGGYGQPLATVGAMAKYGITGGCVRETPQQARATYGWLRIGDRVVVIS